MTNADLWAALMNLTQIMMSQGHVINNHIIAQDKQGVGPQPNPRTPSSRIWDFMRMNPPSFHGTKVDEDPQDFIDDVFKVIDVMGVTPMDKE